MIMHLKDTDMPNNRNKNSSGNTQKSRYFGVALISVFLLVPILFIIIYFISTPLEDTPPSVDTFNSGEDGQTEQTSSGTDSTGDLPQEDNDPVEDTEPEIEIIGTAYLTFDDGPSLTISPGILDILAEENLKATFFMLPYSGGDEIFRRVINEGHEIGNHSFSHEYPRLYEGSVNAFREDILRARNFINDNFGYSTTTFRFPGGSGDQPASIRNPRIDVIRDLGYRYFDWDIDTNDWRRTSSPESIINDVLTGTNGREHVIILMHDVYERTLEALPGMIHGLREQGYDFDILKNHPG